jgi:hypothetical protein
MVLRVDRDLRGMLKSIADRLFTETAHDYSYAAIVRGLIGLGLIVVADAPKLAPLFVGVRIARGRKKGARW